MKVEILADFNIEDIKKLMRNDILTDKKAIEIMSKKAEILCIRLKDINIKQALILKQSCLSCGGDAAVSKDIINLKTNTTQVLLIGNLKMYNSLLKKLKSQYFGLPNLSAKIQQAIKDYKTKPTLCINNKILRFNRTYIMGILNLTPDSFYNGNKYYNNLKLAQERVEEIVKEGADIIDVGGESTRPGALPVEKEEELRRILPVVKFIKKNFNNIILSVDTYKSGVAERVLDLGCDIINDISGLRFDKNLARIVSKYKACLVINHIKGTPQTMQNNPQYEDLIIEIIDYLREGINIALNSGINHNKIIIDPGIGFGKRLKDNLTILKRLSSFKILGKPILIGTSRKSLIGKVLNLKDPKDRLEGSLACCALSIQNGANILRVHDVKQTKRVAQMIDAILHS